MKAWRHFKTITTHKILVMKYCFKIGLYKQGLLHDLSKYTYTEFRIGCRYYQGTRSPNNAEREEIGYSTAWLHHKGRNKHHYEYWMDYGIRDGKKGIVGMPMPRRYIAEMLMDRISASRVYNGEHYHDGCPLEYYERGRDYAVIHPETKEHLEFLLTKLVKEGEAELLRYIRNEFLREKEGSIGIHSI